MHYDKDIENFKDTFGDLLKDLNGEGHAELDPASDAADFEESFMDESEQAHEPSESEQEEMMMTIEELTADPDIDAHAARPQLMPLDRESEARAVSIGLQELRKIREYTLQMNHHMFSEFRRIYTLYPAMMALDYEQRFTSTHMDIIELLKDCEHLIAGDIHLLKEVQQDHQLVQSFEEKRLSLLHRLLERYNNYST